MTPADWLRFHSNVIHGPGCWQWQGARDADGVAIFWPSYRGMASKPSLAVRLAWVYEYGGIPSAKNIVHACGNDWCLNDAHMHLDTKHPAGHPRTHGNAGARNHFAKVPPSTILTIKAMYRDGSENREIAHALNLTTKYVQRITSGTRYKNT